MMAVRFWGILACCALTAATARADTCAVNVGNGTSDELVSVTVRAEFAPPGTEADRNLAVEIGRKLLKDQTVKVSWTCPTNKISYVATGLFANSIRRTSAPFSPRPSVSGALEIAWVQ
jgi:hypothetical protein